MVIPGLVPGPPGPNAGEVDELEEEGGLEVDGELELEVWEELVSLPPPHPVIVVEAHKMQREARRVDHDLAIRAFG